VPLAKDCEISKKKPTFDVKSFSLLLHLFNLMKELLLNQQKLISSSDVSLKD
jgi:hypothetical protein